MFLRRITIALIISMVSLSAGAVLAEKAQVYFQHGVAAFKQARYTDAVKAFKKAKELGMVGSNLEYNLGVSYYKMEEYDRAKQSFLTASKDARYSQLAHYNLGLVANRQGDVRGALQWFYKSTVKNGNKKVNELANRMIDRLEATDQSLPKDEYTIPRDETPQREGVVRSGTERKVSGGVRLAIGFDDNVTQVGTEGATNIDDTYGEIHAYIEVPLSQRFTLSADAYNQSFFDQSSDNYFQVDVGLRFQQRVGNWWFTPSVHYITSQIGSDDYQDITDFRFRATRWLGKGRWLVLRYRYSDIESKNSAFDYLEGDRSQYRVDYIFKTGLGKVRLRYEYETNDRNNQAGPPTVDWSPDRHSFRVKLSRALSDKWNFAGELGWRTSEYGSDTTGPAREDDRFRASLDINRDMNKKWKIGFLWVYTDNDSNRSFDYDKNDFQIYSQWSFY